MSSILIDSREGSRDLITHPPLNTLGTLCQLDSADACFTGNSRSGTSITGIELKRITDLISSRQCGRLQGLEGQAPRMLADYDECWLLTYGTYRCGDNGDLEFPRRGANGKLTWKPYTFGGSRSSPVPYSYIESTFISLTDIGFRVKHVYDIDQAAKWIASLHAKRTKPWPEQCRMFRSLNEAAELNEAAYRRKLVGIEVVEGDNGLQIATLPDSIDPVEYQIARTAASLPGIRYERSMAVARHFNSIEDMLLATADEWQKVPGIGKVIAASTTATIKRRKGRKA